MQQSKVSGDTLVLLRLFACVNKFLCWNTEWNKRKQMGKKIIKKKLLKELNWCEPIYTKKKKVSL